MIGCRHASAVSCLRWGLAGLPDPERVGKGGGGSGEGRADWDPLAREVRRGIGRRCDPDQRSWRKGGITEKERKGEVGGKEGEKEEERGREEGEREMKTGTETEG